MINDFIKDALRNIHRNKKNRTLIIIFTLLLFLLFIDTIIIKSFYSYYDYAINKNIGFRTLTVYYPSISKEDAISELKNISHVSEVYESLYNSVAVQSNIRDNDTNGRIGFIYGTKNTAPTSINGKNIDELAKGEIICPAKFYPDSAYSNPLDIDENKFLTENAILNRDILVTYYRYNSEIINNEMVETKEELTKNMKIVGIYDEATFKNGINVCYASPEDIKDIANAYNPQLADGNYYPLHVIVDEETNVKEVQKEIKRLGKYDVNDETMAYIDKGFVSILFSVTFILAIIIIVTILLILKNYITKKIKSESNYLGILRACGYTKKQVIVEELLENCFVLFISFIISVLIFSIIFALLEPKVFKYFRYIGFNISNNITILFIIFLLVLIISEIINYYIINKKLSNPISEVLKEE